MLDKFEEIILGPVVPPKLFPLPTRVVAGPVGKGLLLKENGTGELLLSQVGVGQVGQQQEVFWGLGKRRRQHVNGLLGLVQEEVVTAEVDALLDGKPAGAASFLQLRGLRVDLSWEKLALYPLFRRGHALKVAEELEELLGVVREGPGNGPRVGFDEHVQTGLYSRTRNQKKETAQQPAHPHVRSPHTINGREILLFTPRSF